MLGTFFVNASKPLFGLKARNDDYKDGDYLLGIYLTMRGRDIAAERLLRLGLEVQRFHFNLQDLTERKANEENILD